MRWRSPHRRPVGRRRHPDGLLAAHAGSSRTDDAPPLEGEPATTVAPPAEPPSGQVVTIIVPGEPEQKAPPKPKPKQPAKATTEPPPPPPPPAAASSSAREPSGDFLCARRVRVAPRDLARRSEQPGCLAATRARWAELHRAGGAVAPDGIRDGGAREPAERGETDSARPQPRAHRGARRSGVRRGAPDHAHASPPPSRERPRT